MGPFEGQMMVGDQGHSKIMRVFQEKVNGVYQGVCFPFREGFASGSFEDRQQSRKRCCLRGPDQSRVGLHWAVQLCIGTTVMDRENAL